MVELQGTHDLVPSQTPYRDGVAFRELQRGIVVHGVAAEVVEGNAGGYRSDFHDWGVVDGRVDTLRDTGDALALALPRLDDLGFVLLELSSAQESQSQGQYCPVVPQPKPMPVSVSAGAWPVASRSAVPDPSFIR